MDWYKQAILSKFTQYFKIKKYRYERDAILCPHCKNPSLTAHRIGTTYFLECLDPSCISKGKKFTLKTIVRTHEPDKKDWEGDKIIQYLKELLGIKALTPIDKININELFDRFVKEGFSLTPVAPNGSGVNEKHCIETSWTSLSHKDKLEWQSWLDVGLNIAIRTGEISNLTTVDIDHKDISDEIKQLTGDTWCLESGRGFHFYYHYDADLPKTRINKLDIDIENTGGACMVPPSITSNKGRKYINDLPIIDIPPKFKEFLLANIGRVDKPKSGELDFIIDDESYSCPLLKEGEGRNVFLFHYGSILSKKFSSQQVEDALSVFNKIACTPPLQYREIKTLIGSINKYRKFDEKGLADEILAYITDVKEATYKNVERVIFGDARLNAEDKKRIDKIIAHLKRQDLIQERGRLLIPMQRMKLTTNLINVSQPLPFKLPYFNELGKFCMGDIILIGAGNKVGKCIAKGLVLTNQGLRDISDIGKDKPEGWSSVNRHVRVFIGNKRKKGYRHPQGFYKEKVNTTIKIVTDHGYELEGTPEHPILVQTIGANQNFKDFKTLNAIEIGDKAVIVTPNLETKVLVRKFKDFKYRESKYAHGLCNLTLSSKIDEDMAKLFGYITGDGSLQKNVCKIYQNSKDLGNIEELKTICSKFNLPYKSNLSKNGKMTTINIFSVVFTSYVRKYLFENNFNRDYNLKSVDRFIPSIILQNTKSIQRAFIEGLYNCESWVTKNNVITIDLSNEKLIKQLHVLLLNFGIVSALRMRCGYKNRPTGRLTLSPEFCHKFLKTFSLAKYKDVQFKGFKNRSFSLQRCGVNGSTLEPAYYLDKIVSKEVINEEKYVYDFNLESKKYRINNQFWSNGFVSHNSHIAMNIIQQLVEQKVDMPKVLISLEPGSRHTDIALQLGLVEGDYEYNAEHYDPTEVELCNNAITIIDWLNPKTFETTHTIFEHFVRQITKHKGLLIIFAQLKDPIRGTEGNWFAPNMIKQMPALAARYFYDDDEGESGYFLIDVIRQRYWHTKRISKIPCKFMRETGKLVPVSENLIAEQKENKEVKIEDGKEETEEQK